jgi:hypothetical protein
MKAKMKKSEVEVNVDKPIEKVNESQTIKKKKRPWRAKVRREAKKARLAVEREQGKCKNFCLLIGINDI